MPYTGAQIASGLVATLASGAFPAALAQQTQSGGASIPDTVSPAVTGYPSNAIGEGASPGGYNLSRWAEDWRVMRDPAERDDLFDRLKFLPLSAGKEVYLTLSGEARLRINHTTNPNLREARASGRTSAASSAAPICIWDRTCASMANWRMGASRAWN